MTQEIKEGFDVVTTVRVGGDTETEAVAIAHNLLVQYGLGAGSVQIRPFRLNKVEGRASLDCLFEEEPKASLDFLFEREERNGA